VPVNSQEAQLQRALDKLGRQESSSSASTTITTNHLDPRRTTSKYYAVRRGRNSNVIYISWALCKSQVLNYPGAEFKAFTTYEAAQEYLGTARQLTGNDSKRSYSRAGCSTGLELASTVDSSSQTTRDRGLQTYIEGIALGFIVGAIATLWILHHQ
jgi:hypothetical protein